jgi:LPXTG-motif cell wall-anchored protein
MDKRTYISLGIVGAAAAGIATYFFTRRKKIAPQQPLQGNERHHLTNVFAKAKRTAQG